MSRPRNDDKLAARRRDLTQSLDSYLERFGIDDDPKEVVRVMVGEGKR